MADAGRSEKGGAGDNGREGRRAPSERRRSGGRSIPARRGKPPVNVGREDWRTPSEGRGRTVNKAGAKAKEEEKAKEKKGREKKEKGREAKERRMRCEQG
ncbi:hypothetical protein Aco03nite_011770 [Actinoplanes couchii]|uniref:Uncharacterized protein n=1 Tax=Actinoplanes couchii TaxID=403638 RepID=A0ABQ3X2X7_9ACTN|nr:hypothetical protein Aco03nite_011770 [Actinoplanes couchii]